MFFQIKNKTRKTSFQIINLLLIEMSQWLLTEDNKQSILVAKFKLLTHS